MDIQCLHDQAVQSARDFKRCEAGLLEALQEVARHGVHRKLGYASLHVYAVEALGLTDGQAYQFTRVALKAIEIPEIKEAIDQGALNVSQARRILTVIEPETKREWIEKASTLKQRDLEREVARANPKEAVRERLKPLNAELSELRCSLPKEVEALIQRAREVESTRSGKAADMADVLKAALNTYLDKHDPVPKAQRNGHKPVEFASRQIPASVRHRVHLRDGGKCVYPGCGSERWLDIHHVVPRSQGGLHTVENLVTLCQAHHQFLHSPPLKQKSYSAEAQVSSGA